MKAAEVLAEQDDVVRTVVNRMFLKSQSPVAPGGGPSAIDVLVVSGGGDYGAFGAGVLQGWGAVVDPVMRRPQFDVVAGVSTGAIIAPMAFIGTPEAYQRLFVLYQNPQPDWIRKRVLPALLTGKPSLATNAGLADDMRRNIDLRAIAAIAAGANEHRLLLVETTNLDGGAQRIWNLTREAQRASATGCPRRFHDIVLASTSIPGVFPPVELDGDLHVDGGVSQNIIFSLDRKSESNVLNTWKREHPECRPPKIRYWAVINNWLATMPDRVRDRWSDVSKRSVDMMIRTSTRSSLQSLEMLTELARREGFDVELRFVAIPETWRPPVEGDFKQETMVSLARLGQRMGADPRCWQCSVPGETERIRANTQWVANPASLGP